MNMFMMFSFFVVYLQCYFKPMGQKFLANSSQAIWLFDETSNPAHGCIKEAWDKFM